MLFLKSFYYYSWAGLCFFLSLLFISLYLWMVSVGSLVTVDLAYVGYSSFDFSPSIFLSPTSCLFSFLVLLITISVLFFSAYYMTSSVKTVYFAWLTMMFVASMLIVINFGDLFSVMVGWDGLGVVSFFLIVYYQSPSSTFSGLFTLFMNRLGDGLLLVSIVLLMTFSGGSSFVFFSSSTLLSISLVLGLCTKSAIYPFSPWLPAAMAAPTPISSLVHSSTLVTAGLYLMLRFSDFLLGNFGVCAYLCLASVFTSLYAGINSLFEVDLKKVVALSTLSHLGFIGLSFSLGWVSLAFIHLVSHAAFKSLLFMSLGSVMVSSFHYQESRYLSSGYSFTPASSCFMLVAVFSLLGLPFFSGFYSKDYVLESLGYSSLSGFVQGIIYLNLVFTFSYAMRIFSCAYSFSKCSSFSLAPNYPLPLAFVLMVLSFWAVSLVYCFFNFITLEILPLPVMVSLKFYPVALSLALVLLFLFSPITASLSPFLLQLVSSMMFLSPLWSNGASRSFKWMTPWVNKSFEYGVVGSLFNSSLSLLAQSWGGLLLKSLSGVYLFMFLGMTLIFVL